MLNFSVSAIIPAAGVGKRFSSDTKKQFHTIKDKSVLYYTLSALMNSYPFSEYIIGVSEEDIAETVAIAKDVGITDKLRISKGGTERADTVLSALNIASGAYALIHDAVRPFITADIVKRVIDAAATHGGAICGIYSRDTVKHVVDSNIVSTINRNEVFLAHTPQVFDTKKLINAVNCAKNAGIALTDEASAYEYSDYTVRVVDSSADNIKITHFTDIPVINLLTDKYFGGNTPDKSMLR